MQNRRRFIRTLIAIAVLLLIPLVAMQFTNQVNWGVMDFGIMAGLLLGAAVLFELVALRVDKRYLPLIALLCIALAFLVWVELAVGIFD